MDDVSKLVSEWRELMRESVGYATPIIPKLGMALGNACDALESVAKERDALLAEQERVTQMLKCPKCGAHNYYDIACGRISAFDWLTKHPCGPMTADDGSDYR